MKVITRVNDDPVIAEVNTPVQPTAKISMHVLREAGADVRAMRTAAALAAAGFVVSIVDITAKRSLPREEYIRGIQVKHIIIPGWYSSRRFEPWFFVKAVQTFFLSTLLLIQDQAEVYHASDFTALPATCIAALLRRKPLIFEMYDLQFPVPETRIGFWRQSGDLLTLIHAVILPRCAGVIATSPIHAQEIGNRFHITEISLLRNVPKYQAVQKSDRLRQHLGLGPGVRITLYQGSLQPDRQLDRLIRAAPFLEQDIVIVLLGKGEETTQTQLETLIESEGVADRVKIIPPVPYEELLDWTSSADIGLIIYSAAFSPNVKGCLPNKLFEFLMAGLPVLASQLDAVAEIIKTSDVGQIVPSLAPEDIGKSINTMLADRDGLARMSCNSLKAAQQELHWEKESQELIRLYSNVLAKRHQ